MKQNLKWKKKILTYFESVFFLFVFFADVMDLTSLLIGQFSGQKLRPAHLLLKHAHTH